ncbi:beta strand repeat-containing protein, partial [Helicobacter marmotae]
DSSPLAWVQNDKIISLAGSQVCHSEGARSGGEESLKESLVANRDSSAFAKPQNDKLTAFTKNPKKQPPLISTILSPLLLPALFPPLLFAQYVNSGGQLLFNYDVSTDFRGYIINTSPTTTQSQDTTVTIKTGATISHQASTGQVWDPVIWNKDIQKNLTVKVENNATINGQNEAWGVLGGYNDGRTNNTQTKVENSGTIEATNTLRAIGVVNGSLAVVNENSGTINGGITVNTSVSVTNKVDTNETLLDNKGTITGGLLINSNQFSTKKVTNSGTIATITNYGNITEVLENSNSISGTLTNGTVNPPSTGSGAIQGSGTSTTNATITKLDNQSSGTIGALTNNNYGTITTLENAGTIQNAFLNYGDITTFTNSGTLANTTTSGLQSNNNFKTITILTNDTNGTISFLRNGGSSHSSATITTLENKGTWTTLENSQTSQNKSSIVTFNNSGTLSTLQNGSNTNAHKAEIQTLTNTGTIT